MTEFQGVAVSAAMCKAARTLGRPPPELALLAQPADVLVDVLTRGGWALQRWFCSVTSIS
jgi:hypothetical protein